MIKLFIKKLTPEGITISGEEDSSFLELNDDENIDSIEPVCYELNAKLVNNGVLVTGELNTTLTCRCAKCLKKYKFRVKNNKICHLYENVNKNEIDLTDDIREDTLVGLPLTFLCSNSCKGLCFDCGQDLNEKMCSCKKETEEEDVWQELDQLK